MFLFKTEITRDGPVFQSLCHDFTAHSESCTWRQLNDIKHPILRQKIKDFYNGEPIEQWVIESLLGSGTIISPPARYKMEHIRISWPNGISKAGPQNVITYAVERLGINTACGKCLGKKMAKTDIKFNFPQ